MVSRLVRDLWRVLRDIAAGLMMPTTST